VRFCKELAELLYEDTDPEQVTPLAGMEEAVRGHLLARIGPEIGNFYRDKQRHH